MHKSVLHYSNQCHIFISMVSTPFTRIVEGLRVLYVQWKGAHVPPPLRSELLWELNRRILEDGCRVLRDSILCEFHDPMSISSMSNEVERGQFFQMRVSLQLHKIVVIIRKLLKCSFHNMSIYF